MIDKNYWLEEWLDLRCENMVNEEYTACVVNGARYHRCKDDDGNLCPYY